MNYSFIFFTQHFLPSILHVNYRGGVEIVIYNMLQLLLIVGYLVQTALLKFITYLYLN